MKRSLPTWLFILMLFFSTQVAAQCPSGSVTNTAGTFNAGQKVCITSNFNGAITLNSGAVMTVINGGNYTGSLTANAGSTVNVQVGGRLAASSYPNFAGLINNLGTAVMANLDVVSGGAELWNNGVMTWPGGWNQNGQIDITNTGCGTMQFSSTITLGNNGTFDNSGRLNFLSTFTMNTGTSLINRGVLYVTGGLTSSGLINNYNKAVFKSSSTLNGSDSIINLGWMVFRGTVTSDRPVRNEGLIQTGSGWTSNSNGSILVNNSNAQFRVGGSFTNNALVRGNGSLHVAGSVTNNNIISGSSFTQRLVVNKVLAPAGAPNTTYNAALTAYDTTNYTAAMAQPALCSVVLPKSVSGLQVVNEPGLSRLQWKGASETAGYVVEFSTDGVHFAAVGELSGGHTNYQFTHYTNAAGNLYYRIRELEAGGRMMYSNVVIVKTGAQAQTIDVFPNPFTNNLQVNIFLNKTDVIEVALFNAGGQLMVRQQRMGQAGSNAVTVNGLSSLMPGVYFARITTGNKTVYSKLIK